MMAMQYEITLPTDYDMAVIRSRVQRTGHVLDGYPGLGLKAYLIREAGVDGSRVNQYAPFYLWADAGGAASFLWSGEGFPAIIRDFGRPSVRTWVGGAFHPGSANAERPRYAVRTTVALDTDADLVDAAASAEAETAATAAGTGVHSSAYAIDPGNWEVVMFTLHVDKPEDANGISYEVLHLAAPEQAALPRRVIRRLDLGASNPSGTEAAR